MTPGGVDAPFEASSESRAIPPRSSIRLPVRFSPSAAGPANDELLLRTNDPDTPTITVFLTGEGFETTPDAGPFGDAGPMPPPSMDGGCGCRASGRNVDDSAFMVGIFALLFVVCRRRQRQNP